MGALLETMLKVPKEKPMASGVLAIVLGYLVYKQIMKERPGKVSRDVKMSGGGSSSTGITVGRFQVPKSDLEGSKSDVVARLRSKFQAGVKPKYCEAMVIGTTPTMKIYQSPSNRISKVVILYVHGGQYVAGSASAYSDVLQSLTNETKMPVYGLDYSLCPESTVEQALKDAVSVYRSLRRNYLVHVCADGCGANLVLRMLRQCTEESGSLAPLSVSLFNPISSYASEPLKSFAEKCLCDDPEELKDLEVEDVLKRELTGLKEWEQYVGNSGVSASELKSASKMILKTTAMQMRKA